MKIKKYQEKIEQVRGTGMSWLFSQESKVADLERDKKVKSICKRLEKIAKELDLLDLTVHINGSCEILESYTAIQGKGEIIATAYTHNWGGGDS
jgi:hypothetical protein